VQLELIYPNAVTTMKICVMSSTFGICALVVGGVCSLQWIMRSAEWLIVELYSNAVKVWKPDHTWNRIVPA
jgi:hypothetical protein